ncbi:MAG: YhcH/YjgK/YiaL family protein, partial [Bacteroidales bacterium]|nr:YhcH/YjgK/YiaL family protein [Bacteroidales bacterium]
TDFTKLENGTYDVVKDEIFAIVNRFETVDAKTEKPEAHRKYIDIQYVFEGEEVLGFTIKQSQPVFKEYNKEEDFELFDADLDYVKFEKGMFAVFFPDDLHSPSVHLDKATSASKVVVKILI